MADSQQPPGARTASTCSAATARGTHAFKIADYSLHKNSLGSRKFIRSAAFAVGGYDWCVRYYPDGDGVGDLAVYLELLTKNAKVRALFQFTLIDHVNASQSLIENSVVTMMIFFPFISRIFLITCRADPQL
ncbi:hypothetical protein EJB05_30754, partial [Eragrostis curvula]